MNTIVKSLEMIDFILALEQHGVNSIESLDVDLVDEYKMIIDDDNIGIVSQYKNCSHFFLELIMDYKHKEIPILIEVV